ncbi:MAG: 23S rRNA (adenine(2503)-C(2))-methyltransferase RlmN, partial [Silvanigrellaceae bacterium]|nr:23S rRNA (adenine(2503)-C(2))-methyltransferase RlmN [Silvanigrellaceae bacterium]
MLPKSMKYALDMSEKHWESWLVEYGYPKYHAPIVMNWLYIKQVQDPMLYSNVPLSLRKTLAETFHWEFPNIDTALLSQDGSEKLLLKLRDGIFSEAVIMPSENRVTLCISSQVGCAMACSFCQTGKMGLTRNLSVGEIIAQVTIANKKLFEKNPSHPKKVTNIVFMGMGEPLDNYENVVEACKVFLSKKFFGLSKNKVTVSTSGLIPEIARLGHEVPVSLAISLHSADDIQRSAMMPINKKYSLSALKEVLLSYPIQTRHGITFEYVMIKGVNDSLLHAKKLVKFVHGLKAKVNLIPMNPHPGTLMTSSEEESMRAFQKYLSDRSIPAPVRYSRGQDVSAACGQLAAKRKE